MSLGLLLLAVEGEPSKSAFYVAGGALAGWAVLVSAVGMLRPGFPTAAQSRALIAVTLILVAAAMATAVITS